MLSMAVEHCRDGDAAAVCRRFRDRGRLAPEGLRYGAGWVGTDWARCYQVIACDDPALLEAWMARWRELVDFEVVTVVTSAEAAAAITPAL